MSLPEGFGAEIAHEKSGVVRLILRGELDVSTAPQFGAALDDIFTTKPVELDIDVGELTFCDSSGLHQFVRASRLCAANNTPLSVIGAKNVVRRVFEVSGLDLLAPPPERT